jgi:hypothetical protein
MCSHGVILCFENSITCKTSYAEVKFFHNIRTRLYSFDNQNGRYRQKCSVQYTEDSGERSESVLEK